MPTGCWKKRFSTPVGGTDSPAQAHAEAELRRRLQLGLLQARIGRRGCVVGVRQVRHSHGKGATKGDRERRPAMLMRPLYPRPAGPR